jgi:alkylation response protein AidB-like acyl-CoA dehydrogenase
MQFQLSEEERMIQSTARDFARKDLAEVAVENNEKGIFPEGIYKKLGELGFLGMTLPEAYGGVQLGTFCFVLALEEISRVCASTAVAMSVHNSLVNWAIMTYGSDELKQRYLPVLATGEILGAYAVTEPAAGSDVAAMRMTAVRTGGEYILNGTKIFISTGDRAGLTIVFARTSDDRTRGISAFAVEPSFPGFSIGKVEEKMGLNASTTVELVFEDCRVPAENLVGDEGMGMRIALSCLDGGRIGIAAQSIGVAQAALDEAVLFAREREQFNTRIIDFQGIRWMIADMATALEAARLMVYRAARLKDAGKPYTKEASMAKLFATENASRIVNNALQIHGGVGYTKEYLIERLYRDVRSLEIYEGTSEVQRLVISKKIIEEYDQVYPV